MADKTVTERHRNETLTDNASLNHYSQCKNCVFRYKNYFYFRGKRYDCTDEYGWKKGGCHIFQDPEDKPDEVYNNTGDCEYYEKE